MRFTEWIGALVLFFSAPGMAETSYNAGECVPASEMSQILKHFPQFRPEVGEGEYCLNGSSTSNLIAGVLFMLKMARHGSMPASPDDLFKGRFADNWFEYFVERIHDFQIDPSCPKGVGAYVYMWGNTMYVCNMLVSDNFTALDRASVFMHEARHIDGFPHVTCRGGPRAGIQGACDRRFEEGGSYAVSVETYAQLAKYGEDLHPALRAYSRAAAITYADEAFDTPTRIDRDEQFLVMDTEGRLHTIHPRGTVKAVGQAPARGRITMRAQHMILFPEDRQLPARFIFARGEGEIQSQPGDLAMEYNGQSPEQRAQLVDMHLGTQWSARVYRTRVRFACNPRSESTSEIVLNEEPASLIYPGGNDRAARSVNLMMQSGRIKELGCTDNVTPFVRDSAMQLDRSYKRIQRAQGMVLGLSRDGQLYVIEGTSSRLLANDLNGRVFELVSNQLVRFFDPADGLAF